DIGVSATTDSYNYGFRIKDNGMASPAFFIARDTGNVGIGTTNGCMNMPKLYMCPVRPSTK
ncbi:MAG: hypothetical protein PHQ82_00330, partial [Bacteroidales bacterium]|nr:hypothetical protein [Bacteroidales bacterium]